MDQRGIIKRLVLWDDYKANRVTAKNLNDTQRRTQQLKSNEVYYHKDHN